MNKRGFTLIELLAVIIILGILMLIAIPSVTNYINNSRKNTYINTIQQMIKGIVTNVNDGNLEIYDTDTTYYVPVSAIKLENGRPTSPYGTLDDAYVVVTYDEESFDYYFVGKDSNNMGISEITKIDLIDKEDIVEVKNPIDNTVGIEGKRNIIVFDENLNPGAPKNAVRVVSGEGNDNNGKTPSNIVCKRATALHTTTCDREYSSSNWNLYNGCASEWSVGAGNTITYGNENVTIGTLTPGDAFDCKVTLDGDYTERFYYITSYDNNAILIYYSNIKNNGSIVEPVFDNYEYYQPNIRENWHGPVKAASKLPSTTQWNNKGLIEQGIRHITTEIGTTKTSNDYGNTFTNEIDIFSYEGKAARLLTFQEMKEVCGDTFSDSCNYIAENTYYDGDGSKGKKYWLENPYSNSAINAMVISGLSRSYGFDYVDSRSGYGIRPVIEVSKSNILY